MLFHHLQLIFKALLHILWIFFIKTEAVDRASLKAFTDLILDFAVNFLLNRTALSHKAKILDLPSFFLLVLYRVSTLC